ncbi:hypothetical protein C8Q75DRAFT_258851 [Abortiporus biennis]|nr:hypothetical protein C8Q75DRAFT_258851 [Abortiporus biennis]
MANAELVFERSFYISNSISLVALGIQIMLFILSYYYMGMSNPRSTSSQHHSTTFYTVFGAVMLILDIIGTSCNLVFGQFAWIEHRDVEGGSAAFIGEHLTAWYNTWGTASEFAIFYMANALLIYQCYIIWASNWKIIALPCMLYIASIPMAVLNLFEGAVPNSSYFEKNAVNFGVPYNSLTVATNVLVTIFICYRLFIVRRRMKAIGMDDKDTDVYTGVAAMMIESAAPVTICGIMFIVTYSKNISSAIAFAGIYGIAMVISPQLIIFRTALGKAWSRDVTAKLSSIRFDGDRQTALESGVSSTTRMNTTSSLFITDLKK